LLLFDRSPSVIPGAAVLFPEEGGNIFSSQGMKPGSWGLMEGMGLEYRFDKQAVSAGFEARKVF
jgi:hypothetical protein